MHRIHMTFDHPSISSMISLLKRASDSDELEPGPRKALQMIRDECNTCRRNDDKPRLFKVTIGSDRLRFNNSVQVDPMFIRNRPDLHMVD